MPQEHSPIKTFRSIICHPNILTAWYQPHLLPMRCTRSGNSITQAFATTAYGQVCFWGLIVCLMAESVPAFDTFFQQLFFHSGQWLISPSFHSRYKWALYTLPKVVIGMVALFFFFLWMYSHFFTSVSNYHKKKYARPACLIFLSILLVPLITGVCKALTGVYGPVDLSPYGGTHAHIGWLHQLWLYGTTAGGRSFPAGHASGGFALMSLAFLPVSKAHKKALLAFGLGAGWAMGMYQMARGEHFLSHTLVSMFLAGFVEQCLFIFLYSPQLLRFFFWVPSRFHLGK